MVVILAPGQSLQPLQAAGYDVLSQRDNATLARRAARLRLPPGQRLHAATGAAGARVWVKEGHLKAPVMPA